MNQPSGGIDVDALVDAATRLELPAHAPSPTSRSAEIDEILAQIDAALKSRTPAPRHQLRWVRRYEHRQRTRAARKAARKAARR